MKFYRWGTGDGQEGVNLQSEIDSERVKTLYTTRNRRDADLFLAQCEIYLELLQEGKEPNATK